MESLPGGWHPALRVPAVVARCVQGLLGGAAS